MRSVDITALKNNLSLYLRLAASGETVLVTDQARIVAQIGPPRADVNAAGCDTPLADAVQTDWLSPPELLPGEPPKPAGVAPLHTLLAELDSDRSER